MKSDEQNRTSASHEEKNQRWPQNVESEGIQRGFGKLNALKEGSLSGTGQAHDKGIKHKGPDCCGLGGRKETDSAPTTQNFNQKNRFSPI